MKQILCLLLFPMLLCFCGQENTDDTNKQEKDKLNSNANQSNKKIDPLENQTKENNHNKDLKSNNLTYKYSNWEKESSCSSNCGKGTLKQTRSCLDVDMQKVDCVLCGGQCDKIYNCEDKSGCEYSEWEKWGPCSKKCGPGSRTRTRVCTGNNKAPTDCKLCGGECQQTQSCKVDTNCERPFVCGKPQEGYRCDGNAIMQGNNLYTYAKSWNECLDICKKINGLSCCVWIERNMGMCGGTKKSKLKDFQGSSKIWAANCWLK